MLSGPVNVKRVDICLNEPNSLLDVSQPRSPAKRTGDVRRGDRWRGNIDDDECLDLRVGLGFGPETRADSENVIVG